MAPSDTPNSKVLQNGESTELTMWNINICIFYFTGHRIENIPNKGSCKILNFYLAILLNIYFIFDHFYLTLLIFIALFNFVL
jgi:hypothetical protein